MAFRRLVLPFCLALVLTGCATTTPPPDVDRYRPYVRLVLTTSLDRILTANPQAVPLTLEIATALRSLAAHGPVTPLLPRFSALLRERLPWQQLEPRLQPVFEAFLQLLEAELQTLVLRWDVPESQVVALLGEMAAWITGVAQVHGIAPKAG